MGRFIACLSTAKFLEAIEETLYYIPPFIRLFIKWPWLLCVHLRRDRIAGGLVMQIGSDLFCAIGFIGKNITLMSDFCSLSYTMTCLHGCFDRR